ncbi:N-acetylgalactosamine kinase like protein [Argiope bruennichi]|uniref:N-acetylgalactosamine kinase like protein n=1 Tax=Argiope bruennichi TaxID=94029 RepID=A0A8T0F841_ARGBR|nr:N-acetylgalactosamine kinase like protein [Argiope bruennichi]
MDYPPVIPMTDAEQNATYSEIAKQFENCFGTMPSFFARVPGRVNLIGEHIDYCGFAVLPMAIEQDIIVAVKINDKKLLNLANFDSKKYKNFSTSTGDIKIDISSPQWYHYFLCGYKGILEKCKIDDTGMNVLVTGNVPPSAGLSSSSALVCASALATTFAHRISLTKWQLASICAESERYIGTQGGGMDQAIGFLAESAKKHGFEWRNVEKLAELLVLLQKDNYAMISVVEHDLPQKSYTRKDLCSILEVTDAEFTTILSENTKHLEEFQLLNRAKHVFEEAARVRKFKSTCDRGNNEVEELGRLMNESHKSCRDLYECSHPVLDELVQTALTAGAVGSRLTGAGWGGCCVSLVKKNQVTEFLETVRKNFYEKRVKEYPEINVNSALFVTKPSGGAAIYTLQI